MMSFRRTAMIVLMLALVAAVALVSVVEGDRSEHAPVRRGLRRRGSGAGGSSSASPPCLLTDTSMTLLVSISSLVAVALLQAA